MSNELFIILFSIVLLLLFLQLIQQFRIHSAAKKQQDALPNLAKELKIGVQQMRENMLTTNTEVVDNIRKLYTAVGRMAEVLEKQRVIVEDLKVLHADDVVAGNAKVLGEWKSILPEMQNFSTAYTHHNSRGCWLAPAAHSVHSKQRSEQHSVSYEQGNCNYYPGLRGNNLT